MNEKLIPMILIIVFGFVMFFATAKRERERLEKERKSFNRE